MAIITFYYLKICLLIPVKIQPNGLQQLTVLKGDVHVKRVILNELECKDKKSQLTEDVATMNRNRKCRYATLRFR